MLVAKKCTDDGQAHPTRNAYLSFTHLIFGHGFALGPGAPSLREIAHHNHQNSEGEQYTEPKWGADKQTHVHLPVWLPLACAFNRRARAGVPMHSESAAIAAGGNTISSTVKPQRSTTAPSSPMPSSKRRTEKADRLHRQGGASRDKALPDESNRRRSPTSGLAGWVWDG